MSNSSAFQSDMKTGSTMTRIILFSLLLPALATASFGQSKQSPGREQTASFDYEEASRHELKPHRRTIPLEGVGQGFNQFRISLRVSADGDVISADAGGEPNTMEFWPKVKEEVLGWKFQPFEQGGKAVEAEVEEYLDLVPAERLPKVHVAPPKLQPNSKVEITLSRTGCLGSCPSYSVTVGTSGVVFEGGSYVVATGKHFDHIDPIVVRQFARKFAAADFYSMDASYYASVTDNPTYSLSISIDGHKKSVEDYVGQWVGMPAVIDELENAVDELAGTDRWVKGTEGMVEALQAERFDFRTPGAQHIVKEAATRGATGTVRELLDAGVPLDAIKAPQSKEQGTAIPFEHVGWLTAAAAHRDTLSALIEAEASKDDQDDQDMALVEAARSGDVEAVRMLVEYGADPNADLGRLTLTESGGGMTMEREGAGSILQYAAESGNPEMVKAILEFHPDVNQRGSEGKTPLFAAGEYRDKDIEGARAECVRLLVEAGADVNARDNKGNTPLHETFLDEVEEELLRLGADVNAQNNEGETPIFTTVDNSAVALYIKHGADLSIRNKKGETVFEAAKRHGPLRVTALEKAIAALNDAKASGSNTHPEL